MDLTKQNIKILQKAVGAKPDGLYGPNTIAKVKEFQKKNNLVITGNPSEQTWQFILDLESELDSDTSKQYFITEYNQVIHKHYLPEGEYINGPINNEYVFIHHTAGRDNPYKCIDHWAKDSRGRIATEFVLGGRSHNKFDLNEYDGVMVQAFPDGGQGWHLGKTGSRHMNRHSVGLELCSTGYLDKNNKTYFGSLVNDSEIYTLDKPFRGYSKWHNYSDKQIEETEKWLKYIADRDNIDIREGLQKWIKKYGANKAFDFHEDAYLGKVKGLLTHTNVRKDKTDCYPHDKLVEMILRL